MKLPNYVKNKTGISRGLKKFGRKKELISQINKRIRGKKEKIKLLEIGCGKGILLLDLLKKYLDNIALYGINLNKEHGVKSRKDFLKNAKENKIELNKQRKNLPFIKFGNATKLSFKDNTFDIIVSNVSFVHIKNKAKVLEEINRVLKLNGIAIIEFDAYQIDPKIKEENIFYNNLSSKEYMPRFLIKKDNFLNIKEFLKHAKDRGFNISIKSRQHKPSNTLAGYTLILKKENTRKLNLNLKYSSKQSKILTKQARGRNPAPYGAVDFYELK